MFKGHQTKKEEDDDSDHRDITRTNLQSGRKASSPDKKDLLERLSQQKNAITKKAITFFLCDTPM